MSNEAEIDENLVINAMNYDFGEDIKTLKVSNGNLTKNETLSIDSSKNLLPEKINTKPSFVNDEVWTKFRIQFPWLYHSGNKYHCLYCDKAPRKANTNIWSCHDSCKLLLEYTGASKGALIRFEIHNKSINHCLAKDIFNKSNENSSWQTLKNKYSWLAGDDNNTRCSACENAYKTNKNSMIVTIWTCPELKNQQSPTHFSIEHRLDRHEKCKNHLLAMSLVHSRNDKPSISSRNSSPVKRNSSPVKVATPISQSPTIRKSTLNRTRITRFFSPTQVADPAIVRRSRKSAPVKSCKQDDEVLPLSISSQQFRTLKTRFPFLACYSETAFNCEVCESIDGQIKFDRYSSLSVISKRILTHLHSKIHNDSITDSKNQSTIQKTRSTRLQMGDVPKIDYKRLSSGVEERKTDENHAVGHSYKGSWSCPQCKSNFAQNISLIEHISLCDYQSTDVVREIACPCNPVLNRFNTITKLDLHVAQDHPNQSLFNCYICADRCSHLLALYEHMLFHHLIDWDPFEAYVPESAPLLSHQCIFCSENVATNVELTNHYCNSDCRSRLQPTIVIEEIKVAIEQTSEKTEIINLFTDIDCATEVEKIQTDSPKKPPRKSLFSQKLEEIGASISPEGDQIDVIKESEKTGESDLKSYDDGKLVIHETESPNNKEPSEKIDETVTDEITVNLYESNTEQTNEESFNKDIEASSTAINNVPPESLESTLEMKEHSMLPTAVEPGTKKRTRRSVCDRLKENTVYATAPLTSEKRIRIPSEKLKESAYLSFISPIETKRRQIPSQKVREGNYFSYDESPEKKKRVRTPSRKFSDINENIDNVMETKLNSFVPSEEISYEKEVELVAAILDKEIKVEISRLPSFIIDQRIPESLRYNEVTIENKKRRRRSRKSLLMDKVYKKRGKPMKRSIKLSNRIKRTFGGKFNDDNKRRLKSATRVIRIKTNSDEIGYEDLKKSLTDLHEKKSSRLLKTALEIENLTPSVDAIRSKRPVIIQSQLSPPSMSMEDFIPDDEIIPPELSFMDRMKKIRQLKKIRTEQQREQMMEVDKTVAEINEKAHGDSPLLKSDQIKKLLNCEQYSMNDLNNILHKESKKRKLPTIDFHESPKKPKHGRNSSSRSDIFSCDVCHSKFPSLRARDRHAINEHKGSKIFKCHVCFKSRTTHFSLRRHAVERHSDNVSFAIFGKNNENVNVTFQCTLCPQQFTSKSGLNRHVTASHRSLHDKFDMSTDLTVTVPSVPSVAADLLIEKLKNADPFIDGQPCPICGEEMDNEYELAIHVIEHDRENVDNETAATQFACPKCCRLFFGQEGKAALKDHYNIVHLEKPTPSCDQCAAEFASTWCYYEHRRLVSTGAGCPSNVPIDPYDQFNEEARLAFVCSLCQSLVAGRDARVRFQEHQQQCSPGAVEEGPEVANGDPGEDS